MKLGFSLFIGIFLFLIGLSMILETLFGISLPLAKVFFALCIIVVGLKILSHSFGGSSHRNKPDRDTVAFSHRDLKSESADADGRRFNFVFGSGEVDLTNLSPSSETMYVDVNTVFGDTTVYINPNTAVTIRANSVFGEAKLPNNNSVAFGTLNYDSPAVATEKVARLKIDGNVVFGSLKFRIKETP